MKAISDRFVVLAKTPPREGSFALVRKVHDIVLDGVFAAKFLKHGTTESLRDLREEFNRRDRVYHPNIVDVYEDYSDLQAPFLIMEWVDGVPIVNKKAQTHHLTTARPIASQSAPVTPLEPLSIAMDLDDIINYFGQLAVALDFLHSRDTCLVHGDLHPGNVLVSPEGLVKVLDFGLARSLHHGVQRTRGAGASWWVAPEAHLNMTRACDIYSFGAMLYVAITGRAPWVEAQLEHRAWALPDSKLLSLASYPEWLKDICLRCLAPEPAARPCSEELTLAFGAGPQRKRHGKKVQFVGRLEEQSRLIHALGPANNTHNRAALIIGAPGVGKTRLAQETMGSLSEKTSVLLSARCRPGGAQDGQVILGLLNSIAHLLDFTPESCQALPESIRVLLRSTLPEEYRLQHFHLYSTEVDGVSSSKSAGRSLIAALGILNQSNDILLFIDDVHWIDYQSAVILGNLMARFRQIRLLMTARPSGPGLAFFDPPGPIESIRSYCHHLHLSPLSPDEATAFLGQLLDGDDHANPHVLQEAIARAVSKLECVPMVLREVARQLEDNPHSLVETLKSESIGSGTQILNRAVERLPPIQRRCLQLLSLPGEPLEEMALYRMLEIKGDEGRHLIGVLIEAEYVTLNGTRGHFTLHPYHDLIAIAAIQILDDDETRELHEVIGQALQALPQELPPRRLFPHFLGAGHWDEAISLGDAALRQAESFSRHKEAAHLCRGLRSVPTLSPKKKRRYLERMADHLSRQGQSQEAARAFHELAHEAQSREESIYLALRQADELLGAGLISEGTSVLKELCRDYGIELPDKPLSLRIAYIVARVKVRRIPIETSPNDLEKSPMGLIACDLNHSLFMGFSWVDGIRAGLHHSIRYIDAMALGDPARMIHSLLCEAAQISMTSGVRTKRVEAILQRACTLIEDCDLKRLKTLPDMIEAFISLHFGEWEQSLKLARQTDQLLRAFHKEGPRGRQFDRNQIILLSALSWMGRLSELAPLLEGALDKWIEQGNHYYSCLSVAHLARVRMAQDLPIQGTVDVERLLSRWKDSALKQHAIIELVARVELSLYQGHNPKQVVNLWDVMFPQLGDLKILPSRFLRMLVADVASRTVIYATGSAVPSWRSLFWQKFIEFILLQRDSSCWSKAIVFRHRAGLALSRSKTNLASELYLEAGQNFEKAELPIYAASCRLVGHGLQGMSSDSIGLSAAAQSLRSLGVRQPQKMARVYAPEPYSHSNGDMHLEPGLGPVFQIRIAPQIS